MAGLFEAPQADPYDVSGGVLPRADFGQLEALPAAYMANAPGTPEEANLRASKFEQLMQNPNAAMMLLKLGTSMMQPMPLGQNTAGHIGSALSSSVDYLNTLQQADARRKYLEAHAGQATASARKTTAEAVGEEAQAPLKGQELQARIDRWAAETKMDQEHEGTYGFCHKRPAYGDAARGFCRRSQEWALERRQRGDD
jgi:hypothetical protein